MKSSKSSTPTDTLYAERVLRLGAREDRGDITGIPGLHSTAKTVRTWDIAVWMDELVHEADGTIPTLIVKRPRRPTEDAYVICRLSDFANLIRDE